MTLDDLRHSRIYEAALHAPSVISKWPAKTLPRVRQSVFGPKVLNPDFHNQQVCDAGLRLDHLIRHILDPKHNFPWMKHLSAMKTFVEAIEEKIQTVALSQRTLQFITPRLEFCREILRYFDEQLREAGYRPIAADEFRHMVLTHEETIENVVFHNPFYSSGIGSFKHFALPPVRSSLLHELEDCWN